MTLRQVLEPPDPGGADSDPLLGSLFCWLQLPFFRCPLQKTKTKKKTPPSLEAFLGCLPDQGAAEGVCLPQAPALLGLGGKLCLAGQQKAHQNRYSHLLGACFMLRH